MMVAPIAGKTDRSTSTGCRVGSNGSWRRRGEARRCVPHDRYLYGLAQQLSGQHVRSEAVKARSVSLLKEQDKYEIGWICARSGNGRTSRNIQALYTVYEVAEAGLVREAEVVSGGARW